MSEGIAFDIRGISASLEADLRDSEAKIEASAARVKSVKVSVPVEFRSVTDKIDAAVASWESKRAIAQGLAEPVNRFDLPEPVLTPIEQLETFKTQMEQIHADAVAKAIRIEAGIDTTEVKQDAVEITEVVDKLAAKKVTIGAAIESTGKVGTLASPAGPNPLGIGATVAGNAAAAANAAKAELSLAGVARAGTTALAAITAIELASEGIPVVWNVIKGDVEKAGKASEKFRDTLQEVPIVGGLAVRITEKLSNAITAVSEGMRTGKFTGWATQAAEAKAYAEELDKQTEKLKAIGDELTAINERSAGVQASARDEIAQSVLSPAELKVFQARQRTREAQTAADESASLTPNRKPTEQAAEALRDAKAAERRAVDASAQDRARVEAEMQERVRMIVVDGEQARLRAANQIREADRLALVESLRQKLDAAKTYQEQYAQTEANALTLNAFDAETTKINARAKEDLKFDTRQTDLHAEGWDFQAQREAIQKQLRDDIDQVKAGDVDKAFDLRGRAAAELRAVDVAEHDQTFQVGERVAGLEDRTEEQRLRTAGKGDQADLIAVQHHADADLRAIENDRTLSADQRVALTSATKGQEAADLEALVQQIDHRIAPGGPETLSAANAGLLSYGARQDGSAKEQRDKIVRVLEQIRDTGRVATTS